MLTFQQNYQKTQRLAKTDNADDLVQIKQDLNTGYQLFNAKLSRYYSRKQQFTNITSGQGIYQTPIDCIRIIGMTVLVSGTYKTPVKEIRDEFKWRQITAYPYNSNWPAYYFMIGNDEFQVWPTPSANVTNGIRFYYQQQDHDLTLDDITSTTTSATASVTNGSPTVTASSGVFTTDMSGLFFQAQGIPNTTWYEIISSTTTTLTLKSAYVGSTASGLAWRAGQAWIIPPEYTDAPMHYALGNYFSAQGNENRTQYHLGSDQDGKRGIYWEMVKSAIEDYSSSTEGNVISEDDSYLNAWFLTPLPPTS